MVTTPTALHNPQPNPDFQGAVHRLDDDGFQFSGAQDIVGPAFEREHTFARAFTVP